MRDAAAGRFTFAAAKAANKAQVAAEVAKTFGVKVVNIKTMIIKGKIKHAGRARKEIQTSAWKKAVVELVKGQKIDLFDVTEKEAPHA